MKPISELPTPKYLVIIPTHNHFDYAARCVRSLLETTPDAFALIIDDASPEWPPSYTDKDGNSQVYYPPGIKEILRQYESRCASMQFATNGGLTRSWNEGLRVSRETPIPYVVCANADLIFTEGWADRLAEVLDTGLADLVGPISNAPGKTCPTVQAVQGYLTNYVNTDDREKLETYAMYLRKLYPCGYMRPVPAVNGFCMMAKTKTWWANSYDARHVFCPRNDKNSKGKPNPTPLMTLNEDELQGRWRAKGLRSAVVPGSFVFHYRSVSRGDRHKSEGWFRTEPTST